MPAGLVGQVGVGLARFGVLLGVEPAMRAARPGAIGAGVRRGPHPFWIPLLVLFPVGPQPRGRLRPLVPVGRRPVGRLDALPVPQVRGDLLRPAGLRRARPAALRAAVAAVGAVGGPVAGVVRRWLVDPHLSPARNWQSGAPTIGKRANRRAGSQAIAQVRAESDVSSLSSGA